MTQVVLNINSKKKWNALKTILELMDIDYTTERSMEKLGETELGLLQSAENDRESGRLKTYTSHRDILGQ
jgi:hypothetical protein